MISCNHWKKENQSLSFYLICLLHLTPLDMTFCYQDWNNSLESVGMFFCGLNHTCHFVVSLLNVKYEVLQGSVLDPVLYLLYTPPVADIIK